MADTGTHTHRSSVLVTACLKTPVDPQTKAPLAAYERRDRALPSTDSRLYDKTEADDCSSDLTVTDHRPDLSGIFFSNEEYYSKLEELKKAHLVTMAELENMYQRKLQLNLTQPGLDLRRRLPGSQSSAAAASRRLRRSHSAGELRRTSGQSDSSDEDGRTGDNVEKVLLLSPKEHIKNMWRDFNPSHLSTSSLQSLPGDQKKTRSTQSEGKRRRGLREGGQETWKHRVTVPRPFCMTLREDERRTRGIRTRSEMEMENAQLRQQLEELTECRRKFRASPVPPHVHLPLYEELRERRRNVRGREERRLGTVQKPFSFLERERLKREQKQLHQPSEQEKVKPFRAKPVPKAVYTAASGELMKEEQLYRSIKIQMRAEETLHRASTPPSTLARRLDERKKKANEDGGESGFTHSPRINREVPDFDATYRRFRKHLEKQKELRPTTACEPFELRTARISSHRERVLAELERERRSPRMQRWPYISSEPTRTPNSSLCSSLSGSVELLPAKATDATKKRHEAVRKVLEQRRRAEEEEERRREKQKQREKKLQKVVQKRAEANDPHLALSQTHHTKLKEFRKQDVQRRKEYRQEIKEMRQRVKGRPLLLEQVAQSNAKQAAEKLYSDTLRGCDLTPEFISNTAAGAASAHSDQDIVDMDYEPVRYRKVFLDDEDVDNPDERGRAEEASSPWCHGDQRSEEDDCGSDDSYHYSDDQENYSDDSEGDADARQQEAAE